MCQNWFVSLYSAMNTRPINLTSKSCIIKSIFSIANYKSIQRNLQPIQLNIIKLNQIMAPSKVSSTNILFALCMTNWFLMNRWFVLWLRRMCHDMSRYIENIFKYITNYKIRCHRNSYTYINWSLMPLFIIQRYTKDITTTPYWVVYAFKRINHIETWGRMR